ncbi:DUF4129 domain-containing protein [Hymenobacter terrenus]|uniref:DUF4129 domain-containing protein n=1 Tax=Hymenobacter terrenus TaxID=1629124 RepID=UPI0018CF9FAE|nr:DUF4129 domain-containing protein [Hymenobacter terrenus]
MRELLAKLKNAGKWQHPVRRVLLALCLVVAGAHSGAQAQSSPPFSLVKDEASAHPHPLPPDRTTALPDRRADAARLRELAAQREFRYVEPDASTDAWDAFWARIWRWLARVLGTRTGQSAWNLTWKYGTYAVVLGLLVFAVLKLLKVDITGAFGRSARRRQLAYDTATENIHEVDFPIRIAEAEEAGNFRLATRLGYLEVLKHLTDRGLIRWQADKTNHTYLTELPAGSLHEAFRNATRQFEYVWYGELRLNTSLYQQARAGQRAVTAQLTGMRSTPPATAAFSNALPV